MMNDADAILTEFAATPEATLAEWTARYPALARDLARLAENRWAGAPAASETAAARVQAIGLQMLAERRAAQSAPLTSLAAAARTRGWEDETLAAALAIPVGLFWKLQRRLIAPESLPRTLVDRLAVSLGRAADEVTAYLRQPPTLAAGASYRADTAPSLVREGRESFAEALAADPDTTDAMRQAWRIP